MGDILPAVAAAAADWLAGPVPLLVYTAAVGFVAFTVRGYSGFGSSMIAVSALTLVLPPAEVVPPVFILEILSSVSLLPSVWRLVDWRSLKVVALGYALFTPLGVLALASAPVAVMRLVISAVIVLASLALLKGVRSSLAESRAGTFLVGGLSGALNGSTGLGGPPAVLFYFSRAGSSAVARATLIAFFLYTDLLALGIAGIGSLLDARTVVLALYLVPFAGLGIWFGNRGFLAIPQAQFRTSVIWLLLALGCVGAVLSLASAFG